MGQPTLLHCGVVVCGGGVREGTMPLAHLSPYVQSLSKSKLGSSGAEVPGGWACVCSRTPWVPPMDSPVRLGVSPLPPQPAQVFSVRGFEALFPGAAALGCAVCLTPQLFLLVYLHANVGPPSPQATALSGLPAAAFPAWSSSCHLVTSPLHPAAHLCPSGRSG